MALAGLWSTVLVFASGLVTPSVESGPVPRGSAAIEQRLLRAHNAERARVGVPPLAWDPALAAAAASYGPQLAALGRLEHSPRAARPGQRENLWMGTRGAFTPEQMVGSWTAERALLKRGTYPAVSASGRWEDVSHYTQLVWPTTTRVGCALHAAAEQEYLICRYSPPGNKDGYVIPVAWLPPAGQAAGGR